MISDTTILKLPLGALVHHYLLSSFAYYILHSSECMSDESFDYICKKLLDNYDNLEHSHKKYIDKEALKAGTAFHMRVDDYPSMVQFGAESYVQRCVNGDLDKLLKEKY